VPDNYFFDDIYYDDVEDDISPRKLSRCNSDTDITRLRQEQEADSIGVGKLVRIFGLKGRADLNSKTGVVEMWTNSEQERCVVGLHEPSEQGEDRVSVKSVNLELAPDAALLHGTPKDLFHMNALEEILRNAAADGFGSVQLGA